MRYVVAFAGARDHYQVARALGEAGMIEKFVTEFYGSKVPKWIRNVSPAINSKLERRMSPSISTERVSVPIVATFAWALHRFSGSSRMRAYKDAVIGREAGRIAASSGAGLLAYSYYASYAFDRAPARCEKIIFQVHPHPAVTRAILLEELRGKPSARTSLLAEAELSYPPSVFDRLSREAHGAHLALTPSSFAKRSLIEAGVPESKIVVVPYGIDTGIFQPKAFDSVCKERPLRLVFVGSIVQRKGLSYLLDAMRRLKGEPVELTLIGRGARDEGLLKMYSDVSFRVLWNVSREELVREMRASDVFVFPSLVESFAHVILEAMSVGLPVLTTTNTAGPDLLGEGRMGFVGAIRDVDFLVDRIVWFLANRDAVAEMGRACQKEAARRTWIRFRQEIRRAISGLDRESVGLDAC